MSLDEPSSHDTHSANIDEKVHKPQSKSYSKIGANTQFMFTHILWIWMLLSVHYNFGGSEGLQGTHIDALNPFSSKFMTLTLRGGLWIFLANLALCATRPRNSWDVWSWILWTFELWLVWDLNQVSVSVPKTRVKLQKLNLKIQTRFR